MTIEQAGDTLTGACYGTAKASGWQELYRSHPSAQEH